MIEVKFKSFFDLIKAFPDEQSCINHLTRLRWNGEVESPFDIESKVYICKNNRYRCKSTGKYFNVKTDTLFHDTKVPLQKWFISIWLITSHKKGISSLQLSRDIDVTQKTAWFMLQRIRNCYNIQDKDTKLEGKVEVDETYIGGKPKNRSLTIRKEKAETGIDKYPKATVFGMIQRQGNVSAKIVRSQEEKVLVSEILNKVKEQVMLYSDGHTAYQNLCRYFDHYIVDHSKHEYVRDGHIYTNTIESFWAFMKRGLYGIYHFTSKKHLQLYIDEFAYRFNSRKMSDSNRFNLFLTNIGNRLQYSELIDDGRNPGEPYNNY